MSDRTKGLVFALLSAVLYGFIPILGKKFVSEFPPLFVALIVTLISDIYFAGIVLWRRELRNLFHKEIRWVILVGFFAALGSVFSFFGLSIGQATEAGFFFQFETFFAAILAFLFLKERITSYQLMGLVIMFLGAYIFFVPGSSFRIGNLLFLGTAFVWALNDTIIRRKNRDFSSFFLAFGRSFFSVVFLLPLAYSYIAQSIGRITVVNSYYFLLYGAVVAGILLSKYFALRHLKTAEATAFQIASPLVTLIVAFFILGEHLVPLQLIGGGFVLAGLYLIAHLKR